MKKNLLAILKYFNFNNTKFTPLHKIQFPFFNYTNDILTKINKNSTNKINQDNSDKLKLLKYNLSKINLRNNKISDPEDPLVLVNKERSLPSDFIPKDLIVPNIPFSFQEDLPKKKLKRIAAYAIENLFAAAADIGLKLVGISGYRSYQRQQSIFTVNSAKKGDFLANQYSAKPGHSEHQTGLAMDVSSASVDYRLITEFGETKEGEWLKENAANFGFIIRYPQGKEDITGYQYEPWHLRYIGIKHAIKISKNNLTLEDYLSG